METNNTDIIIKKGTCHILYSFDIGSSTDLKLCRELAINNKNGIAIAAKTGKAAKFFGFDPQPLIINQTANLPTIGKFKVSPLLAITMYDFGAISIRYDIDIQGEMTDLLALSIELVNNESLKIDSQTRAQTLSQFMGKAIENPLVAAPVEDYLIFEITDFSCPWPASEMHQHASPILARVLRAEQRELSKQEIDDALVYTISYNPNDISIIDWNAAIVFDNQENDASAVLEFANTELLELRFLDYRLDSSLDKSFQLSNRPLGLSNLIPGFPDRAIRKISRMQLEGAILFERVSNAPKLLGDQYYARVYRLASQRFHVSEWNASILRKLDTIEDFYTQLHDGAATQRLELLEWIIVILILLELVLPLLPKVIAGIH
jgi:hypothetical protein